MKKLTSCSCDCIYFYEMTSVCTSLCGEETRVYGMKLYKNGCAGSAAPADCFSAEDISDDRRYVEKLLALFAVNNVMPFHAEELLCEFLSEYPTI